MKEQIEELKNKVKEIETAYALEQKQSYENKPHKHFDKDDLVSDGKRVGVVGWTENKVCNCPYESGYMGVSLISDSRGFLAFAKRDDWYKVDETYYKSKHLLVIELTGLEIEDLKYKLGGRNVNPCEAKTKLLDHLDHIGQCKK